MSDQNFADRSFKQRAQAKILGVQLTDNQLLGAEPIPDLPPVNQAVGDGSHLPILNPKSTYSVMAASVAAHLPPGALYLYQDNLVTVKSNTETMTIDILPMTRTRFATWIEKFVKFTKNGRPDDPPTSISPAQAEIILSADVIRDSTQILDEVSYMRLPVAVKHGNQWRFMPTMAGYDSHSKTYTMDTLPIDWSIVWPIEFCREKLAQIFSEFPLDGGDCPISESRSLGGAVAGMLGQFLRINIDKFPMLVCNANQPGTGKSHLVKTMMAPVHGVPQTSHFIDDENEFRKSLNTMVLEGKNYCFLDDVKSLVSNVLNRFISNDRVTDRMIGQGKSFTVKNKMQMLTTGNQLKASPDVMRRSIILDLFFAGDATQRSFAGIVTEEKLVDPEWRRDMLTLLWSLCKNWEFAGCPRVPHRNLNGFDTYCDLVIGIVTWAGFADPLATPIIQLDSGDAIGDALKRVIIHMADIMWPDDGVSHVGMIQKYSVSDIVQIAQDMDVLQIITLGARDPLISMGAKMRAYKGREFVDTHGRRFVVSDKRTAACATYPITILSDPTTPQPAVTPAKPVSTPADPSDTGHLFDPAEFDDPDRYTTPFD